ncbi:ribonuclease HI family protein [Geovibrio thiophilus]|uniref:Ribonuclease HI family protein n=1 Tax=Geovibrio thiophilus TaxID=139438 RepID=A0A3R5XXB9_9BACT|nr:ribonuclease HI family protein [Geovibrio thiophilus]QAR33006.1 ribonuclease HI family protein [Geovibrio thiophilus]
MMLKVFSDGASRGNPGEAGCGFVILNGEGAVLEEGCLYIGHATNNVAEYKAVLEAARRAKLMNPSEINFYLDSELIVKQMKGEYKVKNETLGLIRLELIKTIQGTKFSFNHVPREQNKLADRLANKAIDDKVMA